jgi:hypothetical protein
VNRGCLVSVANFTIQDDPTTKKNLGGRQNKKSWINALAFKRVDSFQFFKIVSFNKKFLDIVLSDKRGEGCLGDSG